jgi:rhomboid protease GluP
LETFLLELHETLKQRMPTIWVTKTIITINVLVFFAMLASGAGFWHSSSDIQLSWGANFGPATQDGQWWRLASAMFLHFGVMHLLLNMWSLWDAGQFVERMYGRLRFISIYFISGLSGNLLSLVMHGNSAISGGASGAIFGIYGALMVYLWLERASINLREFRWLFWGATAFSVITIAMGFIVTGIDNSAHIGGFIAGCLASISLFNQPAHSQKTLLPVKIFSISTLMLISLALMINIPTPKYRWSDELLVRKEMNAFAVQDQAINRSWLEIINDGKSGHASVDMLAEDIDSSIVSPYEKSFEKLSRLPNNSALPSANELKQALHYIQQKKQASQLLANKIRNQPIVQSNDIAAELN